MSTAVAVTRAAALVLLGTKPVTTRCADGARARLPELNGLMSSKHAVCNPN